MVSGEILSKMIGAMGYVLILLLVEYGVGFQCADAHGLHAESLNPSFGGIWFRVFFEVAGKYQDRRVLILLFVEYGVG